VVFIIPPSNKIQCNLIYSPLIIFFPCPLPLILRKCSTFTLMLHKHMHTHIISRFSTWKKTSDTYHSDPGLFHLSPVSFTFIQMIYHFLYGSVILHFVYIYHFFLIHSSVQVNLRWFHCSANVNILQ
jgi:hypothetical protein